MYAQVGSLEAQADLENVATHERFPEGFEPERRYRWHRTLVPLAVVLVMAVACVTFGKHAVTALQAGTGQAVELQDGSVWKKVLGHDAYTRYENALARGHDAVSTTLAQASAEASPKVHADSAPPSSSVKPGVAQDVQGSTTAIHTHTFGGVAKEFMEEAEKLDPASMEHKSLKSIAHMFGSMMHPASKPSKPPALTSPMPTSAASGNSGDAAGLPLHSPLAPRESLSDGNKCADDEEEFPASAGSCYKKCSDLTAGYFPIRTSPFSCCESEPCGFGNSKIHLNFCSGFDVAGDHEGLGCPNFEGACLTDEEMFGGICYKKCSLFPGTQAYDHRVAPNLCCSTRGFRCLLPKYLKFSAGFAVGGGAHDGNSLTPALPHPPLKELTEMEA